MPLLAAYLHQLDPFALRIVGDFGIRWYGLAYAVGFLVAYLIARALAQRGRIPLSPQQVGDFVIYAVFGVLIGGRLGYVFFYNPSALWQFSTALPFWEVLAIHRGGMASHGGMLGVLGAMTLFARRHRLDPLAVLDLSALLVPFGLFFGRIANFINGELRGVGVDETFPLAVKFPQEMRDEWGVEQWREASEVARHLDLRPVEWRQLLDRVELGSSTAERELSEYARRLLEMIQRGNEEVIRIVEPMLLARHPSQLYQAFAEGIVLGAVLWFVFLVVRPVRAGLIGAAFLIVYGVLRIITEVWRVPDAEPWLGLTRGQWLSSAMVVAGISLVWWIRKRPMDRPSG